MSFIHKIDDLITASRNDLVVNKPNWPRVRVGDIATITNGYPFKSEFFNTKRGAALLRIRDVLKGFTETFYDGPIVDGFWVETGDLIVGMDGDFNSSLWTGPRALLNQRVCKISCDETLAEKKYVAYALPAYLKLINDNTSSLTVKHLSSQTIKEIPLPLPAKSEQERIVAKLDELFTRLDAGEAGLAKTNLLLSAQRRTILNGAYQGFLTEDWRASHRPTAAALLSGISELRRLRWSQDHPGRNYKEPFALDLSNLPKLPKSWSWVSIDQIASGRRASLTDGPFGSNLKTEHYTSTGPRVVRLENIGEGEFKDSKAHISQSHFNTLRRHEVFHGDVLIASLGEGLPRACLVPPNLGPAIVKADCIRLKPSEILPDPAWVMFALNSPIVRHLAERFVHGVGRPRLSLKFIRQIPVPLAPAEEQLEILRRLNSHLDQIQATNRWLNERSTKTGLMKQCILAAAFRGELVPQDSSDELERIRAHQIAETPARARNGKRRASA